MPPPSPPSSSSLSPGPDEDEFLITIKPESEALIHNDFKRTIEDFLPKVTKYKLVEVKTRKGPYIGGVRFAEPPAEVVEPKAEDVEPLAEDFVASNYATVLRKRKRVEESPEIPITDTASQINR